MNLETLDNRLKQLALFYQTTRYAKQKDSLQREWEKFFASLPSSPTVMTATPWDICCFLGYKDKSGKTQDHKNGCIYLGKKGSFKCGCPLRLSYNTVDLYIRKLRAIFHAVGRRGEWDLRLGLGNHVALIAQLGEHCTGIAEVVGSNPAQSLNFFRSLFK